MATIANMCKYKSKLVNIPSLQIASPAPLNKPKKSPPSSGKGKGFELQFKLCSAMQVRERSDICTGQLSVRAGLGHGEISLYTDADCLRATPNS